jgi:hypothetical protein
MTIPFLHCHRHRHHLFWCKVQILSVQNTNSSTNIIFQIELINKRLFTNFLKFKFMVCNSNLFVKIPTIKFFYFFRTKHIKFLQKAFKKERMPSV